MMLRSSAVLLALVAGALGAPAGPPANLRVGVMADYSPFAYGGPKGAAEGRACTRESVYSMGHSELWAAAPQRPSRPRRPGK